MKLFCSKLEVASDRGVDIVDITSQLQKAVDKSGVEDGQISAFVAGSTGSLTTIEFEPGVIQDLKDAINRMAPEGLCYAHEKAWHDGNGHSHVQAALLGPGITIAVRGGRLALGTWQQVVSINHDNRPRKRRVEIMVIGQ